MKVKSFLSLAKFREIEIIEFCDGTENFEDISILHYKDEEYHRENGPAVERSGNKFWYLNGNIHREDGPAVEWTDGGREWWLSGKVYPSKKEWKIAFENFKKMKNIFLLKK